MGFQIDDAVTFLMIKNNHIEKEIDLYTLGKPTSHVIASDLRYVLKSRNLSKLGIKQIKLDRTQKLLLSKMQNNKIIEFHFFVKLLNFKSYKSIDIDKKAKPNYVLDITKKIPKYLINKADMIYDTGSIGYVANPFLGLIFLDKILKTKGIIYHKNPHNNYIDSGYYQINRSTFNNFYVKYLKNFYKVFFTGISIKYYNKIFISNNKNLYKYNKKTNIIFIATKGGSKKSSKKKMLSEITLSFPLINIFFKKISSFIGKKNEK